MIVLKNSILLCLLLLIGLSQQQALQSQPEIALPQTDVNCQRLNYVPMPANITCGSLTSQIPNPCKILYFIKKSSMEGRQVHVEELINFQHKNTFLCSQSADIKYTDSEYLDEFMFRLQISIQEDSLRSVFTIQEESYTLNLNVGAAILACSTYVGFVRGLQTFLQSIQCRKGKTKNCSLVNLPQTIIDKPAFIYRGLMIDTSRHFLPVKIILQTIDAMMYNKLNILHWHIVDQDSFPLILESHPELAKYAAFSQDETYTTAEARNIVKYAMSRGVRIVPELDTPAHAASWGLAPQNRLIACKTNGFMGQFDITISRTYQVMAQVFAQIFMIFPDPLVHLGGDEVALQCLFNKTQYLLDQKISQLDLEKHYRSKQKSILKQISDKKTFMYWVNTQFYGKQSVDADDIVHWWGSNLPYAHRNSKIVISQYGSYYLDMGIGNYMGVSYGTFSTWLDLYSQYLGQMIGRYPFKANVIGAEVCLWSQLSNKYVHHTKIWIRSSAFAERVWNTKNFKAKPDFLGRLTAHQRLMNRRGVPTSPATSQQCETHPEYC